MALLSSKMWLSLSTMLSVLKLFSSVSALAINVSDTSSVSKRCLGYGATNILPYFVTPTTFEYAASNPWGGTGSDKSFNDFADHLDEHGDDDAGRPKHRLTGVRGHCGRRVNSLQFRYSKPGTMRADVIGDFIGGSGADAWPHMGPGGQPFANLGSADGREYVTNIHVRVCEKDRDDRICYIRFETNRNGNAWQCGDDKLGYTRDSASELKTPKNMRLYTVLGYSGSEVDKLQFLWVPAKNW